MSPPPDDKPDPRSFQQQTGQRVLTWRGRLFVTCTAPIIRVLLRLLVASLRLQGVHGETHLQAQAESGRPALLCCWHQRLVYSVGWLLTQRKRGITPGFLVSPSRDGELIAAVVSGFGAEVLRGSANRTGARALRDLYGMIRGGAWPIMHPDGPHGPAKQSKAGTLTLAQMTRVSLLPISFSVDRYWQLGSWDALIVPKPFARVVIHVGEPLTVARGDEPEARAAILTERLNALDHAADADMGVAPQARRAKR